VQGDMIVSDGEMYFSWSLRWYVSVLFRVTLSRHQRQDWEIGKHTGLSAPICSVGPGDGIPCYAGPRP
jgi:hypothetical protein